MCYANSDDSIVFSIKKSSKYVLWYFKKRKKWFFYCKLRNYTENLTFKQLYLDKNKYNYLTMNWKSFENCWIIVLDATVVKFHFVDKKMLKMAKSVIFLFHFNFQNFDVQYKFCQRHRVQREKNFRIKYILG